MDRGDPFTEGGFPEDPGQGLGAEGLGPAGRFDPEEPDPGAGLGSAGLRAGGTDDGPLDDGGLPLRGWVPPDDRLWLHPSEIGKQAGAAASSRPDTHWSGRRAPATTVAAAALAVAAVLLLLVVDGLPGQGGAPASAGSTSLANALTPAPAVAAVTARLGRSLVGLVVHRRGGQAMVTAVAMAPGDLVVTSASAVQGATAVTAVTPGGHRVTAHLVGSDATSGVAVLRVAAQLPPARFTGQLSAGELAMIDCVCASPSTVDPSPTVAVARVDAVGARPSDHLLDTIEADHVRGASWGTVLTDSTGSVAGILDSRVTAGGTTSDLFVPGWLASAVAGELAAGHRIVHGWLGVTGTRVSRGCGTGAVVGSVLPDGPARQALSPGEVVVAVDGRPVCSWPELQADLYVLPPDQQVQLQVLSPSGATTVAVALSASPG